MAVVTNKPKIELVFQFSINEIEARALDALVGYGTEEFLKAFYEKLGKAYMEQHSDGLRTFFQCIKDNVPSALSKLDNARNTFNGKKNEN